MAEDRPGPAPAISYSLANVGAIASQSGSGRAPDVVTDSQLLFADELYTPTGLLTQEAVQQRRDIAERRLLSTWLGLLRPGHCFDRWPPGAAGAKGGEAKEYRRNLETYKSILSPTAGQGCDRGRLRGQACC